MNKQDFLRLLAEKAGSSIVEADKWFKAVTETIGDAVQRTDDLRFVGFGSFKSKIRVLSHVLKIEVNFDNLWEIIKGKSDKNRTKINEIFQES